MTALWELVPDPEVLLALEPEEVAGVVLEFLNAQPPDTSTLNRNNFTLVHTVKGHPEPYHGALLKALMEGWTWLERENLIAPQPGGGGGHWFLITRRGLRMRSRTDLDAYRKANLLPRHLLHPAIATRVVAEFIRVTTTRRCSRRSRKSKLRCEPPLGFRRILSGRSSRGQRSTRRPGH